MAEQVYLRMKKNMEIIGYQELKLKDIAYLSTNASEKEKLENLPIYRITKKDKNIVILDSFLIIEHLNHDFTNLEFQLIGPPQTIIRIQEKKKSPSVMIAIGVWILLFVGTAMTIMNFHYDVSMQEVHQKIHYLLTGQEKEFPLWLQIPYSFGLGIGMLLFFNHWFNKRFNEEPSPLEVEIYNYQQDLDNYVIHYENKLNDAPPPK
ncbi:MAG: stage V sporulation protein AA [Bacillota bacterium]|uniref:stage V sporulation protein AA n=1 Tax=Virgibacillus TaxID=84406 RepID=UPI00041B3EB0|nr:MULTISPECIES: stage V sporulation protein AA [Bacillaceae]MCC2249132.1 stage V sporulation protein AA [Virgibacillus sp. AGTR]MDY7043434.1 stage V sporulation protein AA [Virgibacillus sp. M23]QRZ16960.1 stage V sporulation protein AA [Virgibacillus sp. AGTR]